MYVIQCVQLVLVLSVLRTCYTMPQATTQRYNHTDHNATQTSTTITLSHSPQNANLSGLHDVANYISSPVELANTKDVRFVHNYSRIQLGKPSKDRNPSDILPLDFSPKYSAKKIGRYSRGVDRVTHHVHTLKAQTGSSINIDGFSNKPSEYFSSKEADSIAGDIYEKGISEIHIDVPVTISSRDFSLPFIRISPLSTTEKIKPTTSTAKATSKISPDTSFVEKLLINTTSKPLPIRPISTDVESFATTLEKWSATSTSKPSGFPNPLYAFPSDQFSTESLFAFQPSVNVNKLHDNPGEVVHEIDVENKFPSYLYLTHSNSSVGGLNLDFQKVPSGAASVSAEIIVEETTNVATETNKRKPTTVKSLVALKNKSTINTGTESSIGSKSTSSEYSKTSTAIKVANTTSSLKIKTTTKTQKPKIKPTLKIVFTTPKPIVNMIHRPKVTSKPFAGTKPIQNSNKKIPKPNRKATTKRRVTSTSRPLVKKSTGTPASTKNWPNTAIINSADLDRYTNYTQLPKRGTTVRPSKPVVHKIVTKWSDSPPGYNEIKQSWSDHGVPIPTPSPVINSYSPQFPIDGDTSLALEDNLEVTEAIQASLNPLHQVALDINPSSADNYDPDCPTIHLASNINMPQAKQNCPDLNIVINSNIQQNLITDRIPTVAYDDAVVIDSASEEDYADEVEAPLEDAAGPIAPVATAADPVATPTAANPVSSSGIGWPTLPGFPEFPGLPEFPDFGGIFRTLRGLLGILRIIGRLLRFLSNPYLYLVPMALLFAKGFLLAISLFPWWIPVLYLVATKQKEKSESVMHYKHVHPPVYHKDEWFWNHQTKTWTNVLDYLGHNREDMLKRLAGMQKNVQSLPATYQLTDLYKVYRKKTKKRR